MEPRCQRNDKTHKGAKALWVRSPSKSNFLFYWKMIKMNKSRFLTGQTELSITVPLYEEDGSMIVFGTPAGSTVSAFLSQFIELLPDKQQQEAAQLFRSYGAQFGHHNHNSRS